MHLRVREKQFLLEESHAPEQSPRQDHCCPAVTPHVLCGTRLFASQPCVSDRLVLWQQRPVTVGGRGTNFRPKV
ncbi:hypothetical protein CCMA1212_008095 [Trichoderma ghanense]|uniref:Uncharacterized protein n=1 Tax=Trichoderma ghanense TaxID=65468 RepID=A0ABY2GVW4_9HYPO